MNEWEVRAEAWTDALFAEFMPAFGDDAVAVEAMAAAVRAGVMECMGVYRGGSLAGVFVGRFDGVEYEIVAASGGVAGVSLTRNVLPIIEQDALRRGARAIRINTFRRGLMAELVRQGFEALHVTFWKGL